MRIFWSLVAILGAAVATHGQVSMAVTGTDDKPLYVISNWSTVPIEAFLVSYDDSHRGGHLNRIYYDTCLYPHELPITPGDSYEHQLPHAIGGPVPHAGLRAAVFADGTTFGDEEWVHELLRRRQIMADRLQEVITLLRSMSDKNLSKAQAIAILQQARAARMRASTGELPEEHAFECVVFDGAIGSFNAHDSADDNPYKVERKLRAMISTYTDSLALVQSAKPPLPSPASAPGN